MNKNVEPSDEQIADAITVTIDVEPVLEVIKQVANDLNEQKHFDDLWLAYQIRKRLGR